MGKTIIECPCGRKWKAVEQGGVTYKNTVPYGGPQATPTRPAPQGAGGQGVRDWDFVVPLQISIVSGVLPALWMLLSGSGLLLALKGGVCGTSFVWVVVVLLFFLGRLGIIQAIVWAIEDHFGVDVDGDGSQGKPQEPGRTVINPKPTRPRKWNLLSAGDKLTDRAAFARRVYELQEQGRGTGQKEFRGWGLPSQFKCNDRIHAKLMEDLVDAGLAVYDGGGVTLNEFDSVGQFMRELGERVKVGV